MRMDLPSMVNTQRVALTTTKLKEIEALLVLGSFNRGMGMPDWFNLLTKSLSLLNKSCVFIYLTLRFSSNDAKELGF